MIKKIILISLCLFLFIFNITTVHAVGGVSEQNINITDSSQNGSNSSQNGSNSSQNNGKYIDWIQYYAQDGSKRKLQYRYKRSITTNTDYNMAIYNPEGNNNAIKAGTWAGVNIKEVQSASWSVSGFEYQEIKKVYTCYYKKEASKDCNCYQDGLTGSTNKNDCHGAAFCMVPKWVCPGNPGYKEWRGCTTIQGSTDTKTSDPQPYYDDYKCPSTYNGLPLDTSKKPDVKEVTEDISEPAENKKDEAYRSAHSAAVGAVGSPLGKVKILDGNNLPSQQKDYQYIYINGQLVNTIDSGVGPSGSVAKIYEYKPSNICINVKTGIVSYNRDCQTEEEARIDNYNYSGTNFWQYFSPLNIKSGKDFSLIVQNNAERKLSANECHSVMDNYKNTYQNYIVTLKSEVLKGDYCKNGNCNKLNTGNGSDWEKVSSGCYFTTIVNIPVVQKYYYEEIKKDTTKFNGYNFYYRSIDINNPFPTTPTVNSVWYEWYNSSNKTPDLKKSFDTKTYSIAVNNKLADTIRAYNINNPYPDFSKISIRGKSKFLENIGVESLVHQKEYKLGEGTKTCVKNGTVSIGSDCS